MSRASKGTSQIGLNLDGLTAVHWLAILFAAITGVIHLIVSIPALPGALGIAFVLAGLGFFGAIVLLLYTSGRYRLWLYVAGIPYTLAQVILYYIIVEPASIDDMTSLELVDKTVQLLLIVLLLYLAYTERDAR